MARPKTIKTRAANEMQMIDVIRRALFAESREASFPCLSLFTRLFCSFPSKFNRYSWHREANRSLGEPMVSDHMSSVGEAVCFPKDFCVRKHLGCRPNPSGTLAASSTVKIVVDQLARQSAGSLRRCANRSAITPSEGTIQVAGSGIIVMV